MLQTGAAHLITAATLAPVCASQVLEHIQVKEVTWILYKIINWQCHLHTLTTALLAFSLPLQTLLHLCKTYCKPAVSNTGVCLTLTLMFNNCLTHTINSVFSHLHEHICFCLTKVIMVILLQMLAEEKLWCPFKLLRLSLLGKVCKLSVFRLARVVNIGQ